MTTLPVSISRDRRGEPLVPAALGEAARERGGEHETDDVAAGRAAEHRPAVPVVGVERHADDPEQQVGAEARRAEHRPVGGADEEHGEGLAGDRDRREAEPERELGREARRTPPRRARAARRRGARSAGRRQDGGWRPGRVIAAFRPAAARKSVAADPPGPCGAAPRCAAARRITSHRTLFSSWSHRRQERARC